VVAYTLVEGLQQLVNALALGSVYALLGLGVAAIFSVLGIVNFAQGELVTLSGFSMLLYGTIGLPWILIIPLSILTGGVAAIVVELLAFRPVRGAPVETFLLTSLGLSIIIQNALLLFVSPRPEDLHMPDWTSATFHVGGVVIGWFDVATIVSTLLILLLLTAFFRRSIYGLSLRAAAEDFSMTRMVGLKANSVITLAFFLSGLLAGVAAFFYFGTLGQVEYDSGFNPLLKGFVAAVMGGLGSLSGAVIGGYVLASMEIFFQVVLPSANAPFQAAIVFGMVILVLLLRPQGLSGGLSAAIQVERV
jgi:branched-chain amino acid transport system permease protein